MSAQMESVFNYKCIHVVVSSVFHPMPISFFF